MIAWAVTFFIVAIVAALLGLTGVASLSVNIAWLLFIGGLVLGLVMLVLGRRSPPI